MKKMKTMIPTSILAVLNKQSNLKERIKIKQNQSLMRDLANKGQRSAKAKRRENLRRSSKQRVRKQVKTKTTKTKRKHKTLRKQMNKTINDKKTDT